MKIVFLLPILVLFCWNLQAQSFEDPGTPEERAQKITQEMLKALPLDSTQVDTIHALNLKYAKKAQREIIDQQQSKWGMLLKGNKLNKQKEVELKALLSKSQWENYLKMKTEAQSKMMKKLFN